MKYRYQLYVANRDDPIDVKLADFINNYPEREKLNKCRFARESEGVYTFGSKKITINLSKHNETLQVRKGGGF